jgi:murein DD-endopeptidase MepM/ murein hydrolase activator NlpD
MKAKPVLRASDRTPSRDTADRPRAQHLRWAAALLGAFLLAGSAGPLFADDTTNREERARIWAGLVASSREILPMNELPLVLPVQGVLSASLRDSFDSPRAKGRQHAAIDIMAPRNTPILAAVDGEIRRLTSSTGGGLTIYQFDESRSRVYYYAHLERYRPGLRERTFVRRGEVIGYVGSSGNAQRRSPHLHFAIRELRQSKEWWNGAPVNPYPLLAIGTASDVRMSAASSE